MILGVRRYNDRLTPRLRPNDLDGCVDLLRPVPQMTEIALRRAILQTLNKFLISSDDQVEMLHMHGFPFQARPHCLPMVTAVIERLMDYENSNLPFRSEEHTSELQSLMRNSYAVFCLKKKQEKN